MQLSVSSGKYGLLQRATFLAFGDSLDHTSVYPLADMIASANRWVQRSALWIWNASGTWEFDDSNQTTLPVATTTMVANQEDYSLPATTLQIKKVEALDAGGNWYPLQQIDKSQVSEAYSEFENTAGMPKYYDVDGNSLWLKPAPASGSVTLADGLRIFIAREATTFSVPASYTTADTTEPGFDEMFHDIVCYGMAYDWLEAHEDSDKATKYYQQIELLHNDMNTHYGRKNKDNPTRFIPRVENYN